MYLGSHPQPFVVVVGFAWERVIVIVIIQFVVIVVVVVAVAVVVTGIVCRYMVSVSKDRTGWGNVYFVSPPFALQHVTL